MAIIYEHAGKKYRLADQRDIGKEVYSSDVSLKSAVDWGRKILQSISDTGRGKYNCYSSKDRHTVGWTHAYVELTKEELQALYTERQAAWVAENDVKPGTKVRVTRTAKGYEEGWNDYWMGDMDKYVGKVLEVNRTDGGSIHLLTGDGMYAWNFPYFVLEVVKEPLPAAKVEVPPPPEGYEVVPESEYASYVPQSGDYFLGGMSNAWIPITCYDSYTCEDLRNQWGLEDQLYAGFARRIPAVAERPKVDRPEAPEGWHYIGDDEVFVKGDRYMCDDGDYTQNVLSALGSTIQQRKSQPGQWDSHWVGVVRKNAEKPDLWRLLGDDEIVQEGDLINSTHNKWCPESLKQQNTVTVQYDGWLKASGIGKPVSYWEGRVWVIRRIDAETKQTESERVLNSLCESIHAKNVEVGWWDTKDNPLVVPTKLALIHSEVSEALEGHRKGLKDDKLPEYDMVAVELADVLIRVFDLAGFLNIPLGTIIEAKERYNAQRADHKPENRKAVGGKRY